MINITFNYFISLILMEMHMINNRFKPVNALEQADQHAGTSRCKQASANSAGGAARLRRALLAD